MQRTLRRIGTLLLTIVVFNYILFEEIVWESIARPIITWLQELRIVQKAEVHIRARNRYVILLLFLSLFLAVELLGIAAGALFLSGNFILGLALYLVKIPIAMVTFWLFRITEAKLMRFRWFAWLYDKLMYLIYKLKQTEVYRQVKAKTARYKSWVREKIRRLKERFWPKKGRLAQRVKFIYAKIKKIFNETRIN